MIHGSRTTHEALGHLGLRLWQGHFEGHEDAWLRWCDANGEIIPTGEERATQLAERARQADERILALEAELQRLKSKPSPETP